MTFNGRTINWGKIHFWVSLIIGVQLLFWIVSGVAFTFLFGGKNINGEHESRMMNPAPVAFSTAQVAPARLPDILQEKWGRPAVIEKAELVTHGLTGKPVYVVREDTDISAVVSAENGEVLPMLTETEAIAVALADFTGAGEVTGVEWISKKYQKGYDYHGELPVYRVNFSNWKGTRVYVSANTGHIIRRRNVHKTVTDLFWTLHVFGYLDRSISGNVPTMVMGGLALAATISGFVLYLPFFRRRRASAAQLAEAERIPVPSGGSK